MGKTFLTPEELHILTSFKAAPQQIAELKSLGIPHLVRCDGKPVVLQKSVIDRIEGCCPGVTTATPQGIDFDAI